jgi:hypothetical protein
MPVRWPRRRVESIAPGTGLTQRRPHSRFLPPSTVARTMSRLEQSGLPRSARLGRSQPSQVDLAARAGRFSGCPAPRQYPALTQRSPWVRFTAGSIPTPFNLSRRRLCNPLGRSLGRAAHCCAISVARARAALTATFPRSIRSSPRRATFGAANSCSLVIFMIRPPTARSPIRRLK